MFVDVPSILIVFGGTTAVTFIKFPAAHTMASFKIARNAFFHKSETTTELISKAVELADITRKEGVLGLEKVEIENAFLAKGVQLIVDGNEEELVLRALKTDINLTIERHDMGNVIFKSIGDGAPAMGMIGTLIGLVAMMANLSDPAAIGPAMAVALLTTLYGAIFANAIAIPIADKLSFRSTEERLNKQLILEIIKNIQNGTNPRLLSELLEGYLPPSLRDSKDEESEDE